MKISELYTVRTVVRKARQHDNSISDEQKTFEIPYNPNVDIVYKRLIAKAIDMASIIAILVGLFKFDILDTREVGKSLPLFLMGVIILIPIIESLTGSSIGKLVFGLIVVNDHCKKLTIPFSILRNLYAYFLILLSFPPMIHFLERYEKYQSKKKFYVIKMKDKPRIKLMMADSSFA